MCLRSFCCCLIPFKTQIPQERYNMNITISFLTYNPWRSLEGIIEMAFVCPSKSAHPKQRLHISLNFGQMFISMRICAFIIYKVMKYRKILIKYNAYFKRSCISHSWKYKKLYFHCSENISCISRVKLDVLCFVHWLSSAHFRISNACNFLISGQKHKVWVFIFLVRSQGKFWWLNCRDLLNFSLSLLLLPWFRFWPTWHIMQRHHQYDVMCERVWRHIVQKICNA